MLILATVTNANFKEMIDMIREEVFKEGQEVICMTNSWAVFEEGEIIKVTKYFLPFINSYPDDFALYRNCESEEGEVEEKKYEPPCACPNLFIDTHQKGCYYYKREEKNLELWGITRPKRKWEEEEEI